MASWYSMFNFNSGGCSLKKLNWKISALLGNCERSPAVAVG